MPKAPYKPVSILRVPKSSYILLQLQMLPTFNARQYLPTKMSNIIALVSQYELLELTASYMSALDLLNLASTCSGVYNYIRKNETIFERLKHVTVCDGRGLKERQEYRGFFSIPQSCYKGSRDYGIPPNVCPYLSDSGLMWRWLELNVLDVVD